MAAYRGQSRRMKNALVALLQGLTHDAGGGPEPAFANVLDNTRGVFEGSPNVQVLPGRQIGVTLPTTGQMDKSPMYIVRLRIAMEDTDQSQSAAFDQLYDLTDIIIDAITGADHDSTLSDGFASLGTYMLDASLGDWVIITSSGGLELVCDVNITNTYSQTLN